ncbi:MAG: galactonate dehydratase, partial [Actinobacteria bacterium]|nr:galactonate dehydratase [Actinomycetota bacterium]
PVYQLLGGPVRDRVRVYPRADTPGGPVEQVVEAQRQGFTAFKLSPPDPRGPFDEVALIDATLALLAEVRQAVGPRFDLMVDWHGRLSPAGAIRFLEGANPYRLLFAEEVIPPDNVPAYAQVARAAPGTPCATGERLFTRWGFRELIETRGVAVLQPDVCYAGGISELRRIAAHAETHYLQVAPHNPNGPVAMAASLHVAAAIPNFLILEYARKYPEFDAALREPLKLRNGHFELPTTPGLGVALDLDYVAQHPHNDVPIQSAWHTDGSVADI